MNRHWWIVLHKELRDALRDRRSLRTLALMTLLYPLLMWTALNNALERKARSENEQIRIGISGAAQAVTSPGWPLWLRLALAAALIVALCVGSVLYVRRQRRLIATIDKHLAQMGRPD